MRPASLARRVAGAALVGIATLAALLVTTERASASRRHVHLLKSEPAANDTLAASPKALKFWFSEKVEMPVTTVKLTTAGGAAVALTPAKRDDQPQDAPVWVGVTRSLAPGWYTVNWSTAAKDGHPEKGTFAFAVKPAR